MGTPIVLTAFGTTTRAMRTYDLIDAKVRSSFPEHPVHWAFTSRIVREKLRREHGLELEPPNRVLHDLAREGHVWAVVQSLHLVCGHEFERLLEEAGTADIRVSMGLPLLDSPEDYARVARILQRNLDSNASEEALVLVGHGTDHAIWAAYPAFERIARQHLGRRVFVGVVEGRPSTEDVVQEVVHAGFSRVRLVPFMLVAGVHFREDLAGDEDSWKARLEAEGLDVAIEEQGLGQYEEIGALFLEHIQEALEVIPDSAAPGKAETKTGIQRQNTGLN